MSITIKIKNLRLALKSLKDGGVKINAKIEWIPFFLNKNTPPEGIDMNDYINAKYGAGVADQAARRLDQAGVPLGISFNRARRVVNTMNSHRLIEHVNKNYGYESGDKVMEQIFKTYFERAQDLSDTNVLIECVNIDNLDKNEIRTVLQSDALIKDVNEHDNKNKADKVTGVPFFMFYNHKGEKIGSLSGAQPPSVLEEVLLDALQ